MGARQYVPGLGRFLQVDPVEGGCANDYTYVHGDPVNSTDLTGTKKDCKKVFERIRRYLFGDNYGDRSAGTKHGLLGVWTRYFEQKRKMTRDLGHKRAYESERRRLRNAIDDYDKNDCWDDPSMTAGRMTYVARARDFAQRPYPWNYRFTDYFDPRISPMLILS